MDPRRELCAAVRTEHTLGGYMSGARGAGGGDGWGRGSGPSRYLSHARSEEEPKQDLKAGKLNLFKVF